MAIGDLDEAALGAMAGRVAARVKDGSASISAPADAALMEIGGAAVAFILDVAPRTPESIAREAAIRLAAWLADNRPGVFEHVVKDPSGTEVTLKFANHGATASGFRNSGASALVSRYIVRRAGPIG